jgi:hypothetical protein
MNKLSTSENIIFNLIMILFWTIIWLIFITVTFRAIDKWMVSRYEKVNTSITTAADIIAYEKWDLTPEKFSRKYLTGGESREE